MIALSNDSDELQIFDEKQWYNANYNKSCDKD